MLFQLFQAIGRPSHTIMEYSLLSWCNHKVGLGGPMAYCLAWHIGPNGRSQIIPWDMMAFTENSSGQRQIRQARSDSSSHDSYASFDLLTSIEARKVTLMWGIDILWPMNFLFFPLEAWKSSSSEGSLPRPKPPLLFGSSTKEAFLCPTAPRPWPN